MSLAETNRMLFNKALQQLLDDASVVISASAAAQAAVAFLLGERDFTDAEQRCAMQSKQAALAEMFCAQAQQEAAIIPVRSAFSAAARGGADLAIEFSKLAAAIFPWGAVGQAFQSILNARLVRVESDAAINEARIVKYGPKLTRNRNAIDASLIEFGRLQKEVFPSDNEIRDEIAALKVGEVKDFKIRSKEGRREVHLIAAELGMVSRSYTSGNQRVVSVKNTGGALDSNEEQTSFVDMVEKEFVGTLQKEAETSLAEGIPKEWMPWVSTAAAATVSAQSCVGFLADFGVVAWACELPTLLLSTLCLILGLERQEQVEKYVRGASRIIGGEPPKRARFRAQRLWLLLPWIVMFLPETLVRRCCAANALIVAEIGFATRQKKARGVIANCGRQLSFAEFYTARTRRVHSRSSARITRHRCLGADRVSLFQESLPLTSALALTNTLVATTLGAVNVSFGGLFPIFGLGVCIRAIQKAVESRESAIITSQEGRDAQTLGENFPPYPQLGRQEEMPTEDPRSLRADLKQLSKASFRSGVSRLSRGFLRLFEETKPEQAFNQTSDQKVVRRVQADLEELRVTVRGNDPNWARVGSVVGILTAASVIAPFLLSELLTEVIVPLAGTTLTIFVVIAESEARSSVAQAKVHAAQINEQMSTMEDLVSITSLWKAYLLGMVGVADCNAILGLVLKTPWNVISLYPKLQALQEVAQFALAFASIATCALAARRLLQVREWAASVKKIAADNFNEDTLRGITQTSPVAVDTGGGHLPISKFQRCVVIGAAVLPSILFMVLPLPGREELAEKVVGCTGAAALVVALLMLQAERASCKAERIQASCKRAASLCEAFANRAEQQGALLPFNSAAAIAVAGVITFLTELNPGTAAALTILQAMSWLIASRKGVATKFESRASLQVRSRFSMRGVMAATGSLGMRVKSILIG
ncbi:unnamed protein product [Effrenium voratum]|nr:unnamed protein product [Effrenium voratum]